MRQLCKVRASILLDKQRGSVLTGSVGERWIATEDGFIAGDLSLSGKLMLTDRLSLTPSITLSLQKRSITQASRKNVPDYSTLTPSEKAYQSVVFEAQAAQASPFSYSMTLMMGYTFGNGVARVSPGSARDRGGWDVIAAASKRET